jgi:D-glycero-alpha-D-manno-heptose 1-phosphate guanylyltransferase
MTGDVPKPMARIGRRPFLEILLQQLHRHRFERVILAVGYRRAVIREHFGEEFFGLKLLYSPEGSPLGTGGAVRNAVEWVESDAALVMNGDSYIDANLGACVAYHRASLADVSLVVAPIDGRDDCGAIHVETDGVLRGFAEKQGSTAAPYLSAGIYVMSPRILYDIPIGVQVSLETEMFPRWLAEGRSMRAFISPGPCVDIGTPERYRSAQSDLAAVEMQTEYGHSQNLL